MKSVVVIAPHPDDETLGCGGVLLRHKHEGDRIHWLIVTRMDGSLGFTPDAIARRDAEIAKVESRYGFDSVHRGQWPTSRLDTVPMGELVSTIGAALDAVSPDTVYLPFPGDAHSDHRVTFDAATACVKWFRRPSIRRILAYETLSETETGLNPELPAFRPNVFVNVSDFLMTKLDIVKLYASEGGAFPFPRSGESIRALAALRGSACGCQAAEAFMLLKETCP